MELYKKYRPTVFRNVLGQTDIVESLQNIVLSNNVPTGLLFTGTAGTGKTTCAYILAKALNCTNREETCCEPCNSCDSCVSIDNNVQVGVSYFSMANNPGVDTVRKLVEDANISTTVKHPIYIIDEFHNASTQAFDALLIPLEAKNSPVTYIFCTTSVRKIPNTIMSRVLQYNFRKIYPRTLYKFMSKVCEIENIVVSDNVLNSISKSAGGSVRQALSFLQSHTYGGGENSFDDYLEQYVNAMVRTNFVVMTEIVEKTTQNGVLPEMFMTELFEEFKNLYLLFFDRQRIVRTGLEMVELLGGEKILPKLLSVLEKHIVLLHEGMNPDIVLDLLNLRFISVISQNKKH